MRSILFGLSCCALALASVTGFSAQATAAEELKTGKVTLQSVGPLAFGEKGILFIGDPKAAVVYAVDTGDTKAASVEPVNVSKLDAKLAGALGVKADEILINDLVVNPTSNKVYLSVTRGKGTDALPVILRLNEKGETTELSLDKIPFAKAELRKPAEGARQRLEAITSIKVVKNKVYVAGLSNEEFASTLRVLNYPFDGKSSNAGIQIYHGAHGKYETASPVRTFTPIELNGKEEILAAYTCTPLVRIPVSELKDGAKVKGTTVAELGNQNKPLDIVPYSKDNKTYLLMANSRRGVMKVSLENIDKIEAIVSKINGTAGLKYETIESLKGVEQLDKLGDKHAVLLIKGTDGYEVKTIELP